MLKNSEEIDAMIAKIFENDNNILKSHFHDKTPFSMQFENNEPFPVSNLEELSAQDVCGMVQELQDLLGPSCKKISTLSKPELEKPLLDDDRENDSESTTTTTTTSKSDNESESEDNDLELESDSENESENENKE